MRATQLGNLCNSKEGYHSMAQAECNCPYIEILNDSKANIVITIQCKTLLFNSVSAYLG